MGILGIRRSNELENLNRLVILAFRLGIVVDPLELYNYTTAELADLCDKRIQELTTGKTEGTAEEKQALATQLATQYRP